MKKSLIFALCTILLILPLVSSISLDMKSNYQPRETIITKLSGNILQPISYAQVQFKDANVLLALDSGLVLENDAYYIWAIAPPEAGNYTLIIKDVFTTVNGSQKKIDFLQNFTVSGNQSQYSISPGAIATRENFTISLFYYGDNKVTIQTNFPEQKSIIINPGSNEIKYSTDRLSNSRFILIQLGPYLIPAYLKGNSNNPFEFQQSYLDFNPSSISRTLASGSDFETIIQLKNNANYTLNNIQFSYNNSLISVDESSISLDANENVNLTLTLKSSLTSNIYTTLRAYSGNISVTLPVVLQVRSNNSIIHNLSSINNSDVSLDCAIDIGGNVCTSDQTCTGQVANSVQGNCCLGVCQNNSSPAGKTNWTLIILIVILVAIGGYVFFRYKKSPKTTGDMKEKVSSLDLKHASEGKNLP